MDESIVLISVLLLVILVGSVTGLVAFFQLGRLKSDIALLKKQIAHLSERNKVAYSESETANSTAKLASNECVDNTTVHYAERLESYNEGTREYPYKEEVTSSLNEGIKSRTAKTSSQLIDSIKASLNEAEKAPSLSFVTIFFNNLRKQFQTNWMTWIGGVALAFGGVFLAKYSLDSGLLSPSLRLFMGALFGVGLITSAEILHRKKMVFEGFNNYIPAALAGGGFISCFALTLLAYSSYHMLSPMVAFVMLAGIALAASSMALRLGPLLALLGIVGAYSVPLWVSTGSGDIFALLMYVAVVSVAMSLVAQRVNRNWLWYLLWVGHIGWYWLALTEMKNQQYWLLGGFALLGIVGLIAMMRLGWQLKLVEYRPYKLSRLCMLRPDHPLLIAVVLPLFIIISFSLPNLQWQIVLLSLIILLLFLPLQNSRWDLWQGGAVITAVFLLITQNIPINSDDTLFAFKDMYGLGLGIAALLMVYGMYFGTRYYKRLSFHLLAAFSPFVIIASLYVLVPKVGLSTAYSVWCVLLLLTSALLIKRAQSAQGQWQQFTFWIAANANITLSLTMLLADSGLTLALAIQVLVISYLVKRYAVPLPHWPIKLLVAAVLGRLTFAPWTPSYMDLTVFTVHWSMVVYPLSVTLFWFAAKQWQHTNMKIWLHGAALHCFALFITTETSYQLVGHYPTLTTLTFYEQILLTCNWLALGCVYLHRMHSAGQLAKLYKVAGLVLAGMATLLLIHTTLDKNPLISSLYIGETPLINWLLLVWFIPSFLALWLAHLMKCINPILTKISLIGAGVLGVLAINALIRQCWQGPYIYLNKPTSELELYSYSVIWLVLGAIVVITGHFKAWLLVQKVGLGILAAVIVKVFLIDMANLAGLLKALSFIGLGLSLVGLSWLFQKLRSITKS
jgi:uncharacterized membrane protein